ncbi:MAG: orotidine-5'-phosphate decarboxylase [Microbacterium sp.]
MSAAASGTPTFGDRVRDALSGFGPLCVGIDPHEHLLREWGLDASAAGVREFGLRAVDAAAGRVGIVKPQVSFFERYGSEGFAALEEVLASARAAGLLVIADAKRGDIGTTMDAYARAWLAPGSPLEADALTVNPYLGVGALTDTLRFAQENGKGAFVLAATSNPEARLLQSADVGGGSSVADWVAHEITIENSAASRAGGLGSIGLVVGATVDRAALRLSDASLEGAPILAPGFGAQGAQPGDLSALFGELAASVIASESRSLLTAGPTDLAAAIDSRAQEYRSTHG